MAILDSLEEQIKAQAMFALFFGKKAMVKLTASEVVVLRELLGAYCNAKLQESISGEFSGAANKAYVQGLYEIAVKKLTPRMYSGKKVHSIKFSAYEGTCLSRLYFELPELAPGANLLYRINASIDQAYP